MDYKNKYSKQPLNLSLKLIVSKPLMFSPFIPLFQIPILKIMWKIIQQAFQYKNTFNAFDTKRQTVIILTKKIKHSNMSKLKNNLFLIKKKVSFMLQRMTEHVSNSCHMSGSTMQSPFNKQVKLWMKYLIIPLVLICWFLWVFEQKLFITNLCFTDQNWNREDEVGIDFIINYCLGRSLSYLTVFSLNHIFNQCNNMFLTLKHKTTYVVCALTSRSDSWWPCVWYLSLYTWIKDTTDTETIATQNFELH